MKDLMERLIAQMVEGGLFFADAVSEFEKKYIRQVLDSNRGNQFQSAKALGIHRNTLRRKIEQYKLASRNGLHRTETRKPKPARKRS